MSRGGAWDDDDEEVEEKQCKSVDLRLKFASCHSNPRNKVVGKRTDQLT